MRRGKVETGGASDRLFTRRTLLRGSAGAGVLALGAGAVASCVNSGQIPGADANGLSLAPGFTSRIIARATLPVAGTGHVYRIFPDGAATFADPLGGGWYLTVNHEVPSGGGVTSIRFAADGTITNARSICAGTRLNCAGGPTPWGTWLSGEEFDGGHIWECDPTGARQAVERYALGTFKHEAATVGTDQRVYLTEDHSDGALYRFTPSRPGDLTSGVLEVATGVAPAPGSATSVVWRAVPNRNPAVGQTPTRHQVAGTIRFKGGEGIDSADRHVWFTTKGDNRIWQYDATTSRLSIRYQGGGSSTLSGVDNLLVDERSGCLVVAEDGGDMQVVAIRPDNTAIVVAQVLDQGGSEITGPCFSPNGQRLYFSSQRAPIGELGLPLGVTYEISGPFDVMMGR